MDVELLNAIRAMMKEELEPLKADVAVLKSGMAEVKESLEEIRTTVGAICDWVDEPEPRPKKLM